MFATVEVTASAKSPGMVSRVRSLRGYSVFSIDPPVDEATAAAAVATDDDDDGDVHHRVRGDAGR